jgi:preprotein translocase subunit YajC
MNFAQFLAMAPAQGGDAGGGMMSTLFMFAAITLVFYFMIIRPQAKRQKAQQELLSSLKKGDKVVTNSGIHGTISEVEDKTFLVQIADNTRIRIDKTAVGAVPVAPAPKK